MLRFGKTLGSLNREVSEIKLVNSADPLKYESILNLSSSLTPKTDKEKAEIIKKLFNE